MDLSSVEFRKYQALGNDYIVVRAADLPRPLTPAQIRRICHPHYGFGADGIALDVSTADELAVRFFNPDGSEAEISGNGMRIFARYLWDEERIGTQPAAVRTATRTVQVQVAADGREVIVEMGRAIFDAVDAVLEAGSERLRYCAVNVGNPHCVVPRQKVSPEEARRLGPLIEHHPKFPHRTNVQFMQALDRENIRIEIWERGAGYTLASGSSSCAAAAAAHRLGMCDEQIAVHMPGGELQVLIGAGYALTLRGAVAKVWRGYLSDEVFGND